MRRSRVPAILTAALAALALSVLPAIAGAQGLKPAPNRGPDEGKGPYNKLVIRGVNLIDGTGGPMRGPVDIVIQRNKITQILNAGPPGRPLPPNRPPNDADYEVDATGMYVTPGFVDLHVHGGEAPKNPEAEYPDKLWLAHGVTTVRGVPYSSNSLTVSEKQRSERNEIVAPRIINYQRPGQGWSEGPVDSPEKARAWVRWAARNGVDGLKLGAEIPEIMEALIDEAHKNEMGTTAHLGQTGVAQMDALDAARLGLDTVTHFYGHFEALMKDNVVQPFDPDHNHNNEQDRFGAVAQLWDKVHPPGSPEWMAYLREQKALGTTFDPTMTIYSASRDQMRSRNADWHEKYTLPSLWRFFQASRDAHGSYFFDWTTWHETAWRNFYQVWFRLLNDYKKMGGRITTGSDSGFIYQNYGFGYIQELELLQEAGLHPLEVMQAATMNGAKTLYEWLGEQPPFGIVRPGMLADLVIAPENPLRNVKTLYGSGHLRLNDQTGKTDRVGGVRWTVKDGIVYDAKQLLADVAAMVQRQKTEGACAAVRKVARKLRQSRASQGPCSETSKKR